MRRRAILREHSFPTELQNDQGSGANGGPGIDEQVPQFEGVENTTFPTFVMGVPTTNMTQINDTSYLRDGVSRVIGAHTLKVGGQFHIDQVNDYPNGTFNGTFNIDGTETGDPFFNRANRVPYMNNYMLSIQRQISSSTLLTMTCVGNQGHCVLAVADANLGNAALCQSIAGCGQFGEDNNYTTADGETIYGTRDFAVEPFSAACKKCMAIS
jgi:hypothetical protein